MGSSLVPPLRKVSYLVMSSLPLGFFAPWQPKHFSLRMGATSLMKLTGFGAAACADCAASIIIASAAARAAHRIQKQRCDRNMDGTLQGGKAGRRAFGRLD